MVPQSLESPAAPSRTFVHASFWLAHIGVILGGVLVPANGSSGILAPVSLALVGIGIASLFVYFFAIGKFAKSLGRSGLVWGGLAFVCSPVGVWISYALSFGLGPKENSASKVVA